MLYIVDATSAQTAFELASRQKGSIVVLIQDGVTLAPRAPQNLTCYSIAPDIKRRGLGDLFSDRIKTITYADLVDLILEHPVMNLS